MGCICRGTPPLFTSRGWDLPDGPVVVWDDPCTFDLDESAVEPRSALEATPAFCIPIATPPRPVDSGGDEDDRDADEDGDDDSDGDGSPSPTPSPSSSGGETGTEGGVG